MLFLAKFPIRRRMIPQYIFLIAVLAGAVYTVFLITSFQMRYLSYLLYDRSYLSAVYQLLNTYVIRKLIICVILFFMALLGMFMYFYSYRMPVWLQSAILSLLSMIYCESLLEMDTIFYIGSTDAQTWYRLNFCSLILLSWLLFYLTYEPVLTRLFIKLRYSFLFSALPALSCIWILTSRRAKGTPVLSAFLTLTAACFLLMQLYLFFQKKWPYFAGGLPVAISFPMLCYLNYRYLYCNKTITQINSGTRAYALTLYLVLPLVLYLYILSVRRHNVLLNSRDTNRKIQEIENAKYLFLTLLSSGIRNHTHTIRYLLDEAEEAHPDLDRQLPADHIRRELLAIHTLFHRVSDYNIFNKSQLDVSLTSIDAGILMQFVSEHLVRNRVLGAADTCHIAPDMGCVRVVPERLIQSICDIIFTLKEQFPGAPLAIDCSGSRESITLLLSLDSSAADGWADAGAQGPFLSPDTSESLDYIVSCCRYIVSLSKGTIRLDMKEQVCVRLCLPLDSAAAPPCRHEPFVSPFVKEADDAFPDGADQTSATGSSERKDPSDGRDPSDRRDPSDGAGGAFRQTARQKFPHPEQLLLLTSDLRQEDELRRLLPLDQYAVTLCSSARFYDEKIPELGEYSLIIVGNLYHGVYYNDFLIRVRQYFPMTELPVLLLLPDLLSETEVYIHANINDFLVPPFSRSVLELKIKSLLSLKRTAAIASEARLELLQSQMNPHFIFNSINSIMQFCIKTPMTAYRLLEDFSEYLRGHLFTLSLNRLSTIQREIDLISAYLKIEKARFPDRILYRLNTDCDDDFPILPLLIEPLVENSIKHSPMREGTVTITVDIWQEDDKLHVSVMDTGNGMTRETIESILSYTSLNRSIGLYNVCNRLRYYYHTVPQIESTPGKGTSIGFVLSRNIQIHDLGETA